MKVPLSFPKLKHNLPCAMSACLAQTMVALHVNLTPNGGISARCGLVSNLSLSAFRHQALERLGHVVNLTHGVEKRLGLDQFKKRGLQTSNVIARQNGLGLNLAVGPAQGKARL